MTETATQTKKITAAERAKYHRETYMVHDSEDCVGTYSASEDTIEDILEICSQIVINEEYPCPGVVIWLDGRLMGAAKLGDQGEAILTDFTGPYPGWERRLPD